MNKNGLGSAVQLVQLVVGEVLGAGGVAVDATAGNGYDTLFLARQVGSSGVVYAFDVQEEALRATKRLLADHGVGEQVVLLNHGHEEIGRWVTGPVDGVIFNLGYLPGGSHDLLTKPETTVLAVEEAVRLLRPGGRIGVVVYTGHPGGPEELRTLEEFARSLDPSGFSTLQVNYLNRSAQAPVIIFVEKARSS